ncbi:MAG TPA: hypothetical protein VNJ50_15205 [Gelidibacter sp.]|uniref:hypothetical protein n=1 Tax=Gelidibacter sp. TaxID=2018083 RepID=UPI002C902C82|nr:hypothetical protein [Gelidibacter sp.]HXK00200.1 hypothetical protein [Gelidibacter sp.]
MENPFKKIITNEKLPDKIRARVIDDINMIKLALDITDLLVVKYPDTIGNVIKNKNNNNNN